MSEKTIEPEIIITPEHDGQPIILEQRRFLGATYYCIMTVKFKENQKVEVQFTEEFSGPLWPFYAIGIMISDGFKILWEKLKKIMLLIMREQGAERDDFDRKRGRGPQ